MGWGGVRKNIFTLDRSGNGLDSYPLAGLAGGEDRRPAARLAAELTTASSRGGRAASPALHIYATVEEPRRAAGLFAGQTPDGAFAHMQIHACLATS